MRCRGDESRFKRFILAVEWRIDVGEPREERCWPEKRSNAGRRARHSSSVLMGESTGPVDTLDVGASERAV